MKQAQKRRKKSFKLIGSWIPMPPLLVAAQLGPHRSQRGLQLRSSLVAHGGPEDTQTAHGQAPQNYDQSGEA